MPGAWSRLPQVFVVKADCNKIHFKFTCFSIAAHSGNITVQVVPACGGSLASLTL